MTEMEKMEAMKRAYAEMILNTAKEAAARVMASELRARRTEQELVSVKEEAANMLLRLKQMIDTKTKEAEITSLGQKEKCEELECQLNEAEGIILDLREEVNQGQEQLDMLKKKQVLRKRENQGNLEEVRNSRYELLTPSLNPGLELSIVSRNNLLSDWSRLESSAKQNVTLYDQIKEGCSHRICATDMSLVEETFSDVKILNQGEDCTNAESLNAIEGTSVIEENPQHGNGEGASIIRRSVRKRKLKFWGDVIAACGLQSSHQFKKSHHGSADLSCLATRKMKKYVKHDEDLADGRPKVESLNDKEVSKELTRAEAVPENMELVDVLVKQDELAANVELTSASRIECDVEDSAADAKASNLSYDDSDKLCKYTFNRKWRKKSAIYPEKVLDRGS